jgi:hypothetical protein
MTADRIYRALLDESAVFTCPHHSIIFVLAMYHLGDENGPLMAAFQSVVMYASETWVLKEKEIRILSI